MHVHRRLAKGMEVLDYYTNNEWEFDNTDCLHIFKLVNSVETKKYYVEIHKFSREKVEWSIKNNILGARRYILKESDDTLPSAKRLLKMWVKLN